MRETSSSLTNFLNQEFVICHNDFIVYPFSPVKLNFAGQICSGIDINLANIFKFKFCRFVFPESIPKPSNYKENSMLNISLFTFKFHILKQLHD